MSLERLLDVRDLEQPEPLLRALAALNNLGTGEYLRLLSHRDPVLLYPLLVQQDFSYETQAVHEATTEVLIWRAGDAVAEQAAHNPLP
jgi:TusA-related sulfurtransferase